MEQWWITDGPLPGGRKIQGPFGSQDAAIAARGPLEEADAPKTYWVASEKA